MAFDLSETPNSRETSYQPPSVTLHYVATGEYDQDIVYNNCLTGLPSTLFTTMGTLYLQDLRLSPQGGSVFNVEAPYGTSKHQVGSYSFNFSTTGAQVKVKCAKAHQATYYASGYSGASNPHNGMIGVKDDQAEGTDIVIPALKLNVVFRAPSGVVTVAMARSLAGYTGYTNSDTFLGFQPGELLFLGAEGSDGTEAESEITYQFVGSQNATGLTIGGITGISKNGHDYAWVEWQLGVDGSGGPALIPFRCNVERVYDSIGFAATFGWGGP